LRVENPGSKFIGSMGMTVGVNNTAHRNAVELYTGALLQVPSLTIGNAANSGNRLLLAGGRLETGTLTFNGDNCLAVKLQLDGLPDCAHVTGAVVIPKGLRLCPSAVKGAPVGLYPVLVSDTGVIDNGHVLDIPDAERGRWKFEVLDNTLFVKYSEPRTLFIIKYPPTHPPP